MEEAPGVRPPAELIGFWNGLLMGATIWSLIAAVIVLIVTR